ncbi:hypothetical protein RZS08_02530, partial [Arthrospira platensis SPKY1]|nr:hypothetical protein [Arthrospira platensis SPKY1]
AKEYPQGFDATMVPHDDPMLFVTVAAALHRRHEDRDALISGQMPGHERVVGHDYTVIRGDDRCTVRVSPLAHGYEVVVGEERFEVDLDWSFGAILVSGSVNGQAFTLQFERKG